ncbi:hypothetical protein D3C81_2068210 [compost metagenome]
MARRMEQGGVEEDGVALGQRQLHAMPGEIIAEGRLLPGEETGLIALRIRQVQGGTGFDRHVAMGDGTLQGQ